MENNFEVNLNFDDICLSLVSYIDLLGFGSDALKNSNENEIIELIKKVSLVRNAFDYNRVNNPPNKYDIKQGRTILAFSDCVVVAFKFKSPISCAMGEFDSLTLWLTEIARAQYWCVLNEIFLRGGIHYGLWYYKDEVLISPALVKAYLIESSKKLNPIIAITDELYYYLKKLSDRSGYSAVDNPINMLKEYSPLPEENLFFLDYLSVGIDDYTSYFSTEDQDRALNLTGEERQKWEDDSFLRNRMRFIEKHKMALLNGRAKSPDDSKSKYDFLINYHNDFIKELETPIHDYKIPNIDTT